MGDFYYDRSGVGRKEATANKDFRTYTDDIGGVGGGGMEIVNYNPSSYRPRSPDRVPVPARKSTSSQSGGSIWGFNDPETKRRRRVASYKAYSVEGRVKASIRIARYGVQLEKDTFNNRTADFLWMMMFGALSLLVLSTVPLFKSFFLGSSMVFMLIYIWSREYHNTKINLYGLFQMKAFYFPWAMLALDVIFGSSIIPDLLGLLAGHLYYFLAVLHPLSGGKNILKTPLWVHKLVARFRLDAPPVVRFPSHTTAAARPSGRPTTSGTSGAFTGRSYRLNS